ncbi:hypothetical protein TNCT_300621 [Trichonephila clavata]|uniref:Uncharacterized protein n=1 Tax=Trichonephila clavata TaxID=2740835 RepID=A0A8X6KDJ9_TRICU|nr:hypothetical protein TNCT_300621 [Trichonephila clavata]
MGADFLHKRFSRSGEVETSAAEETMAIFQMREVAPRKTREQEWTSLLGAWSRVVVSARKGDGMILFIGDWGVTSKVGI